MRDAFPAFAPTSPEPVFTGEMIFPWMFEQHAALRPLKAAAELLAQRSDWPALYHPARLGESPAQSAAVIYHDDMYVDATASIATARAIAGLRPWITNQYQHDGGYEDGERLFDRLPDGTWVYPGHGNDTTLGTERPHLGEWRERGW